MAENSRKSSSDGPQVVLIAALDEERGIGKGGELPWRIPADLKRFKALTMGHPIVMGRKTFESIGKPLPGRTNIVVTRNADYGPAGVLTAGSVEAALELARSRDAEQIFVIGGAEIYAQALQLADRLELTLVDGTHDADAFFPPYERDFAAGTEEAHPDESPAYRFVTLERRGESR